MYSCFSKSSISHQSCLKPLEILFPLHTTDEYGFVCTLNQSKRKCGVVFMSVNRLLRLFAAMMADHQLSKIPDQSTCFSKIAEDTELGILLLHLLIHSSKRELEKVVPNCQRWCMQKGGACQFKVFTKQSVKRRSSVKNIWKASV